MDYNKIAQLYLDLANAWWTEDYHAAKKGLPPVDFLDWTSEKYGEDSEEFRAASYAVKEWGFSNQTVRATLWGE